jgi:hypothetical protein
MKDARRGKPVVSLRERCRVRDEEHVATLERIAADDSHPGFQLVAIRDLMDRSFPPRGMPILRSQSMNKKTAKASSRLKTGV